MSLLTLKRLVKKMIEEEDSTKPLTDEHIAQKLEDAGIHVTRSHRGEIPRRHAHPQYPPTASKKAEPCLESETRAKREANQLVILTGLSGSGKKARYLKSI